MAIDFQGLLDVLHAGENEPHLDMRAWVSDSVCGTTHCLIGSFCDQYQDDSLYLTSPYPGGMLFPVLDTQDKQLSFGGAIAARFGITRNEADWLFTELYDADSKDNRFAKYWMPALNLGKEQALARLRKFIYYKLHKQEMTLETARRIPGRNSALLAATA